MASAIIAWSSQCSSVSRPCAPARRTASRTAAPCRSKSCATRKILTLAQPAARRCGMSSSVAEVSAPRTGCKKMSAMAWRRTSAPSRARVARGVSPGAGKDILPSVVIPPARAAADPLVKSSTQRGPSVSSPGGSDRWTCASTPPGRTSIPVASMARSPCRSCPITAIVSPAMPMIGCRSRHPPSRYVPRE